MSAPSSPQSRTDALPERPALSYPLGDHGFIYATRHFASGMTMRPPAVLLLSADYQPFGLTLKSGHTVHTNAAIVAPRVERSLDTQDASLLSFNVMPSHESFHVFGTLQRAQVLPLDRHAFGPLDARLRALADGSADLTLAQAAFAEATQEALRQLPPTAPPDPMTLTCIRALEADPEISLEALARQCGRSQQIMSRQFSAAVGISLRDYQTWLKQRKALELLRSGRSLTEVAQAAGFGDSPQFSRTFMRWYGVSPSISRNEKFMRVITRRRSASDASDSPPPPAGSAPRPADQDAG